MRWNGDSVQEQETEKEQRIGRQNEKQVHGQGDLCLESVNVSCLPNKACSKGCHCLGWCRCRYTQMSRRWKEQMNGRPKTGEQCGICINRKGMNEISWYPHHNAILVPTLCFSCFYISAKIENAGGSIDKLALSSPSPSVFGHCRTLHKSRKQVHRTLRRVVVSVFLLLHLCSATGYECYSLSCSTFHGKL